MLPENRRTQLDGIVQDMVKNKESDDNIKFVVNDFKSKYDTQPTKQESQADVDYAPQWATKHPELYANLQGIKGATKEVARFAGETAGLVGGGMLGAATGNPVMIPVGAGLGYAGVKQAERFFEDKPQTIGEHINTAVKDVAIGGAMEAGGQIAGKVIGGTLEKISRPSSSSLPKEVVAERIKKAKELDIDLTPAEATQSSGLALYESMLDKAPFSAQIIRTWRELRQAKPLIALREKLLKQSDANPKQVEEVGEKIKDQVDKFLSQYKNLNEAQISKLRDNVLKKLGTTDTYENIGKTAQETISARSKAYYDTAGELYKNVENAIPKGTTINLSKTRDISTRLLEEEMKKAPSLQNKSVIATLRDLSGKNNEQLQQLEAYPEAIRNQIIANLEKEGFGKYDWKTIQSMRSELNARIAQADSAIKTNQPNAKFQSTPEAGTWKQLRKAIDDDISSFSEQSGGDIKDAFTLANSFYKEGKKVFNSPQLRRIMTSNPERVVDMVFRPKGGAEIDLLIQATGKDFFNKTMKPAFTKRLLDTGDVVNPKAIETNLKKYGDELLNKVYTPEEITVLKNLAKDGKNIMEDKLPSGTFLKTLVAEKPEIIVDSILGSTDKMLNPKSLLKNILLIRSVVDKPTYAQLQLQLSERLFSTNKLTDLVQPETLAKKIMSNERVLKAIYSPEQVKWLQEISQTTRQMASAELMAKNPSGTAQNIITWSTWQAIWEAIKSAANLKFGSAAANLFQATQLPKIMAKFYLSETGRRYFALGMKTPIGTKRGVAIATKLAEIAVDPNSIQTEEPIEAIQE